MPAKLELHVTPKSHSIISALTDLLWFTVGECRPLRIPRPNSTVEGTMDCWVSRLPYFTKSKYVANVRC